MFEKAGILIVDDMPEHIAFAGTILRNEGFRALGATSAKAALKMMEKSKPHLVLLDIKMEGMTVWSFAGISNLMRKQRRYLLSS